jgi:hypothetical protein
VFIRAPPAAANTRAKPKNLTADYTDNPDFHGLNEFCICLTDLFGFVILFLLLISRFNQSSAFISGKVFLSDPR